MIIDCDNNSLGSILICIGGLNYKDMTASAGMSDREKKWQNNRFSPAPIVTSLNFNYSVSITAHIYECKIVRYLYQYQRINVTVPFLFCVNWAINSGVVIAFDLRFIITALPAFCQKLEHQNILIRSEENSKISCCCFLAQNREHLPFGWAWWVISAWI